MDFNKFYEELESRHKDRLSRDELLMIYEHMDKGDYTRMGHPRYTSLNQHINQVFTEKTKPENNGKKLVNIDCIILESYPPQYRFTLKWE